MLEVEKTLDKVSNQGKNTQQAHKKARFGNDKSDLSSFLARVLQLCTATQGINARASRTGINTVQKPEVLPGQHKCKDLPRSSTQKLNLRPKREE